MFTKLFFEDRTPLEGMSSLMNDVQSSMKWAAMLPKFSQFENFEYILIVGQVAGFEKKQLTITYSNKYLIIEGKPNVDTNAMFPEANPEQFYKEIFVEDEIIPANITASCENGLLRILIPKQVTANNNSDMLVEIK